MGLDRNEGDAVHLTHEFLGEMLTVRPTVSVALTQFKKKAGILETSYG